MRRTLFLVIVVLLSQTVHGAQIDLKTQVDQQVELIKSMTGSSENFFFELPGTSTPGSPVQTLTKFGIDAIPYLIPHLSDDSTTQAYRAHGSGKRQIARVNEYIIFAINKIADHVFDQSEKVLDRNGNSLEHRSPPMTTEELQNEIQTWWEANHDRSLLERKIDDINDPNHLNRFSAYKWLGDAKAKEATSRLEKRIETLLTEEVNSLKQSEMAACSDSLGKIGDKNSAVAVRNACLHLGRYSVELGQVSTLFQAYHALAMLGFKDEAISNLKEIEIKYINKMEPQLRDGFLRDIAIAEHW